MRPIPASLKREMENDPFYKRCCITGTTSGKIDWHHNLIFGGKQVNEKFCILPLSKEVHDKIVQYKERCNWIMLNRATDDQLRKYSKVVPYIEMRDKLNKKYGVYPHR